MGSVIMIVNLIIIVLLAYNSVKCYLYAIDVNKTKNEADLKLYIWVLLKSMFFLAANMLAAYTGFISFILKPNPASDPLIVTLRCADRTGMLIIAISLIMDRLRYNPFDGLVDVFRKRK